MEYAQNKDDVFNELNKLDDSTLVKTIYQLLELCMQDDRPSFKSTFIMAIEIAIERKLLGNISKHTVNDFLQTLQVHI